MFALTTVKSCLFVIGRSETWRLVFRCLSLMALNYSFLVCFNISEIFCAAKEKNISFIYHLLVKF